MTPAEHVERVREALEETTPCGCPRGMKYHASNCGVAPDEIQAHFALTALASHIEEQAKRIEELEATLAHAEAFIEHQDMSYRWAEWCEGRDPADSGGEA